MFTTQWATAERKYDIVGSMRPETAADCCLLQEGEIKQRIDHHARAAGKDFAFLEAEILLVEIALYLRLLRNKRDMSELAMFHLQ